MEFHTYSEKAFTNAISKGILSTKKGSENYAGLYMYMYSDAGKDYFKHIITRRYTMVNY